MTRYELTFGVQLHNLAARGASNCTGYEFT